MVGDGGSSAPGGANFGRKTYQVGVKSYRRGADARILGQEVEYKFRRCHRPIRVIGNQPIRVDHNRL